MLWSTFVNSNLHQIRNELCNCVCAHLLSTSLIPTTNVTIVQFYIFILCISVLTLQVFCIFMKIVFMFAFFCGFFPKMHSWLFVDICPCVHRCACMHVSVRKSNWVYVCVCHSVCVCVCVCVKACINVCPCDSCEHLVIYFFYCCGLV